MSFRDPLPWESKTSRDIVHNKFFNEQFLRISKGIFDINVYIPLIMISVTIMSLVVFMTTFKGIDSSKYAVYIIIPLPYILMLALFIKGITLEGKYIGWTFLFSPDWSKLYTLKIWKDAASQVLFSAGIGHTVMIHFSSFRKDTQPMIYSSIGIPTLNFLTSIFLALTLFAYIGQASLESGVEIKDLPIDGLELSFVFYPSFLATMPYAQVWSLMFFLMLILVGVSTVYSLVDVIASFLIGLFKKFKYGEFSKACMILFVVLCVLFFNLVFL